jgi:hypothetical protein
MTPLTCVSCYYPIKNKHGNRFLTWFKNTLSINCPYVIFGNKEGLEIVQQFRGTLPTHYIEMDIQEFTTYKYKDRMVTHPLHCPSVELNLVWNEKIFMIEKALAVNPFNSEWFMWIDAGICTFRDKSPSTEQADMSVFQTLPKEKIIYCESSPYIPELVTRLSYYHHVSGTSYIIHRDLIELCAWQYETYLNRLVSTDNIWTDQLIWTHIFKDSPDLFYKWFTGYGESARYLFGGR